MQRSPTQVLYRYLPDAVFAHEDGLIARVDNVDGQRLTNVNKAAILEAVADELQAWTPDQRGIPDPRTNPDQYVIVSPENVRWDVFPITFECTRRSCGRVRRWDRMDTLVAAMDAAGGRLRCVTCGSRMRQLRYLTAHNCGQMQPLHTQRCQNCNNTDDMFLEDLGSFGSSTWRCRVCGFSVGTRFTACNCGQYAGRNGQSYQQGYTDRDSRLWYPQSVNLLNISAQTYDHLQAHPQRSAIALASWLGDEPNVAAAMQTLNAGSAGPRMSSEKWAAQEALMRASGIDDAIIDSVRKIQGPTGVGVQAVLAGVPAEVLTMTDQRGFLERAALFDTRIVDDRKSLADVVASLHGAEAAAATTARSWTTKLGVADVSVTQQFPIVAASYGFTRSARQPGQAHLRAFKSSRQFRSNTTIFAVPADTEALLVTVDPAALLGFLYSVQLWTAAVPTAAREQRLAIAGLFAVDDGRNPESPAGVTRRLVHSMSHALLRSLDDGQSGFGESSLAEWIVPDCLTFAIYVASYKDFTLGAFDTVLRRRVSDWFQRTSHSITTCDNDPMCSQTSSHKPHAACDRCLHLSFGCRTWNNDLDRKILRRFWLWTQRHAAGAT